MDPGPVKCAAAKSEANLMQHIAHIPESAGNDVSHISL